MSEVMSAVRSRLRANPFLRQFTHSPYALLSSSFTAADISTSTGLPGSMRDFAARVSIRDGFHRCLNPASTMTSSVTLLFVPGGREPDRSETALYEMGLLPARTGSDDLAVSQDVEQAITVPTFHVSALKVPPGFWLVP